MVETLAVEWAPCGIEVNGLVTGRPPSGPGERAGRPPSGPGDVPVVRRGSQMNGACPLPATTSTPS